MMDLRSLRKSHRVQEDSQTNWRRRLLSFMIGRRALVSGPTVLLIGLLALPAFAPAKDLDVDLLLAVQPQRYVAGRAIQPIQVDGNLEEAAWQQAPWTQDFVDIDGDIRPKPRFRTRAKMLWDDTYFYVAAELEEPHVWATLTGRDDIILHDQDFEVFIDPNGDTHNYYELEVNAFATEWDLLLVRAYRDGAPAVHEWDIPGLRTGVQVHGTINDPSDEDEGWTLEIAFPWEGIRRPAGRQVPPQAGDVWRVNFSRVEWQVTITGEEAHGYAKVPKTPEDNWVWSHQGLVNMHFPEQWGYVQFSDAAAGSAPVDFELPPEEEGKHLLREIYYRQRNARAAGGHYLGDLDELGIAQRSLSHFVWPPTLQVTDYGYEAWIQEATDLDGDGHVNRWVLTEDSRVRPVRAPE